VCLNTHTFTSLIAERQGGRCLTVVHEYAEHISTVLSKDRSTLKSSSCSSYPLFFSFSFSPIPLKFLLSIYLSILPPPFFSYSGWNGKSMHWSHRGCTLLFFLFPIIFNSLNLELPWQQEEQGWRGRAPYPSRGSKARRMSGC